MVMQTLGLVVPDVVFDILTQVDPALKGTRNVLGAVAKNRDSVKRVVLTSSCAGVPCTCSISRSKTKPLYA